MLYVQDGTIVTGAGSAAGLDASLHLMRQQFGARVAASAARRMVVPPHRSGGQAQFIARAVPDCDAETLGPLLTWITENLDEDLSVEELARRSHMSPRTFARRFRAETGTTPHSWVIAQRVQAAEEYLELTDHPVDWIAGEVGFGNAAAMRHHFSRARGVSPQQYRRTFTGDGSLLGQLVAAYLPRRGARQVVEEGPGLGPLGRGEPLTGVRRQLRLVRRPDHRGADAVSPVVVRYAEHRDVLDPRVLAQRVLDLERVDVHAAGDDQVGAPAVEVEVALVVDAARRRRP